MEVTRRSIPEIFACAEEFVPKNRDFANTMMRKPRVRQVETRED